MDQVVSVCSRPEQHVGVVVSAGRLARVHDDAAELVVRLGRVLGALPQRRVAFRARQPPRCVHTENKLRNFTVARFPLPEKHRVHRGRNECTIQRIMQSTIL